MLHIFKQRPSHVAVIGPSINPIFNEVSAGILSGLDGTRVVNYTFGVANGHNDEQEMKAIVEEVIFAQYYDLIFSMGKSSTRIAMELTKEHRIPIPVVFTGIIEPKKSGFILSEHDSGNNLTGLEAFERDYEEQIKIMLHIAESPLKKILLVYTSFGLKVEPREISNAVRLLSEYGVGVISLAICNKDNIVHEIVKRIAEVDMIMLPRESAILVNIKAIIEVCNVFRKPLYTSDTVSVTLGAPFGFGDSEFNVGLALAKKALPILKEKRKPRTVPTTLVEWHNHLEVNMTALAEQDFKINVQKLMALPNVKLRNWFYQHQDVITI
jgi:ABC-type uncharacterized transport system substrate-binding protein